MNDKLSRLIWIDLEMTGLDPQNESIIEIATLITDGQLNLIAEGPNLVIHQSDEILNKMDEWNTKQHGQSGLINKVRASTLSIEMAEEETLRFLQQYVPPKVSPMCGNTVSQDRRFLNRYMPKLEAYFHYRHLDVSTVKVLAKMWAPIFFDGFQKASAHRALDDIKESVAELRYYRHCFFKLPVEEIHGDLPVDLYEGEQVKTLDHLAMEEGKMAAYDLMCRAGEAAFDLLLKKWPAVKSIDVVCGPGNNGGDGFVLARLAKDKGMDVNVYQVGEDNKITPETQQARQHWQKVGSVIAFENQRLSADIVVDALLGTGVRGTLLPAFQKAIEAINQSQRPVLAIDLPSGLNPNTGSHTGIVVNAAVTLTFIGLKTGLLHAVDEVGALYFSDLNVPKEIYSQVKAQAVRLAYSDIIKIITPRKRSTHKGEQGHVCIIGGGHSGYSGAVCLAGEAALRVGAGLASAVVAPESLALLARAPKELMCYGYQTPDKLAALLEKITVLIIGSGMGQGEWGKLFFHTALHTTQKKVIDADGLNWLAQTPQKCENWILTPHPGEAARLLKKTTKEIQEDRISAARLLRETYGGVIVLKGASTVVIDENNKVFIQAGGLPNLATGGTGDVLAGMIGGLLAQGFSLSNAALLAVSVHAAAAVQMQAFGERGLLASDLLCAIPRLLNGGVQLL